MEVLTRTDGVLLALFTTKRGCRDSRRNPSDPPGVPGGGWREPTVSRLADAATRVSPLNAAHLGDLTVVDDQRTIQVTFCSIRRSGHQQHSTW